MHVTHKKKFTPYQYHMNNNILQKVEHHPYLGIQLSSNLSWAQHIHQTTNKANSILGLLKRNLWNCSRNTKEIAYKTLVRPRLEYCSTIWDPYQKTHQEQLEKVQRRAARFVTNDYRRTTSITAILKTLDWESLQNRRTKSRLVTIFKETHGITPTNIKHLHQENQTKHNTRQTQKLNYNTIRSNKDCYHYSLYPRTIPLWNSLPPSTKAAKDVAVFKSLVNLNVE
ncbi:uncharacterized protein LOC144452542 [Glandiceps talaboti]